MLKPYKNRTVTLGQKVEVYRNLHNGLFSIKDPNTGLVIAHGEDFTIKNAVKCKSDSEVFILGDLIKLNTIALKNELEFTSYNSEIVFLASKKEFVQAEYLYFNKHKAYTVSVINNSALKITQKGKR